MIDVLVERGKRVVASGLDQDFRGLPFGVDARAALPRRARRQAAGRLPPLRRAGDDDAAARRWAARARRRRDDRRRRARLVRGALPRLPRDRRAPSDSSVGDLVTTRALRRSAATRQCDRQRAVLDLDGAAEQLDQRAPRPPRPRSRSSWPSTTGADESVTARHVDHRAAHDDARPRRGRRGAAPPARAQTRRGRSPRRRSRSSPPRR